MGWREAALQEGRGLKSHFVEKHGWSPIVIEGEDVVDVVVTVRGRKLGDKTYALRIRYLEDWQVAGRREAFVDPDDHTRDSIACWPEPNTVRGVNPTYPHGACVCLRGVYGYHSILHPTERPDGTSLLGFLLELQAVIDE